MPDEQKDLPAVVMLPLDSDQAVLVGNALAIMQGLMMGRLDIGMEALRQSKFVWTFDNVLTIQRKLQAMTEVTFKDAKVTVLP